MSSVQKNNKACRAWNSMAHSKEKIIQRIPPSKT